MLQKKHATKTKQLKNKTCTHMIYIYAVPTNQFINKHRTIKQHTYVLNYYRWRYSRELTMHLLLKIFTLAITLTINISAHALNNPDGLKDDPVNPVRLYAIFHDDVPTSKRTSAFVEHIRPFTVEFEKITGRKIHVIFDQDRPPYTSFNYKSNDHDKMFDGWHKLAWDYKKRTT